MRPERLQEILIECITNALNIFLLLLPLYWVNISRSKNQEPECKESFPTISHVTHCIKDFRDSFTNIYTMKTTVGFISNSLKHFSILCVQFYYAADKI